MPEPGLRIGKHYRLKNAALGCLLATILSGCSVTGFVADRLGSRLGTALADQVPTPPAAVSVKPGGNSCEVLKALGWGSIRLGDVQGNDGALNTIGATRDKARACP